MSRLPRGVQRAVRALLVISRIISRYPAVMAASINAASSAVSPRPGAVAPRCSAWAVLPHRQRSSAVPTRAPSSWAMTYPAKSWACTWPRTQKASVTAGFRCAPLRRPSGLMAMRLPVPAKSSPVRSSRADGLGTSSGIGLPGPKSRKTAERPPSSSSAVPVNSHPHSAQCHPAEGRVPVRGMAASKTLRGGPSMRALTVRPGEKGSLELRELPEPTPEEGPVLVDGLAVGLCGTDREIVAAEYGEAPEGSGFLVLGHENLGRVLDTPASAELAVGDLVVGIVRRPDPVPCGACAVGEWDMCRNGRYT